MLLKNVFNCFQLTRLVIVTLPADAPHLEIFSQNTMPSMKLKQLTEGATKHGTYERFQRIGGGGGGGGGGVHLLHIAPFG